MKIIQRDFRNCHTCALAKDQGRDFFCTFRPDEIKLPLAEVLHVQFVMRAINKDNVPGFDCLVWKAGPGTAANLLKKKKVA